MCSPTGPSTGNAADADCGTHASPPAELRLAFTSHEQWLHWATLNPWFFQETPVEAMARQLRLNGFVCPIHNRIVSPGELKATEGNYREGFLFRGFNCRVRAVWLELLQAITTMTPQDIRIYAPEAVTAFARELGRRYPRFVGSEYQPAPGLGVVRQEDLERLRFPEAAFDAVVVNEVFEHLPEVDRVLEELHRVIRPGGKLVATFPFNLGARESIVKARLTRKGVEFLAPPEYHGDPVNPKGCLVYQIPGWDILDRMHASGWSRAEMVLRISAMHGVTAATNPGVFVLLGTR